MKITIYVTSNNQAKSVDTVKYLVHLQWVQTDNYPNSDKVKVCSPPLTVIELKSKICVPTAGGGWEATSVDNCVNKLKSQCPEFNEAECMWLPLSFNQSNVGYDCQRGHDLLFPTCRLKYYASLHSSLSRKTWMEINYVNQYGTSFQKNTDYYIIELHRYINEKALDYFGNAMQPDYPLSVPDSKQPGGYPSFMKSFYLQYKPPAGGLCPNTNDVNNFCSKRVKDIFQSEYKQDTNPIAVCVEETLLNTTTNVLTKAAVCKITVQNNSGSFVYGGLRCLAVLNNKMGKHGVIEFSCNKKGND
ncbi:hypothetical protein WDU94_010013 [Cyamophila willieti]